MTPDELRERAEQVQAKLSSYRAQLAYPDASCCTAIAEAIRDAVAMGYEGAAALADTMPMSTVSNLAVSLKVVAQRIREGKP